MDFEIKGIKFNKGALEKISLSSLRKNDFSYAHLFLLASPTSKPLLIKKAGEFLDNSFFEKYKTKEQFLFSLNLANQENVLEIKNILQLYSKSILLNEKRNLRKEFLKNINEGKYTQADIQNAFHDTFNILPESFYIEFSQISEDLLQRSSMTAMMSVILSFLIRYDDFALITDIYNICFLLDYGLVENEVSYHTIVACEKERLHPGSGKIYLEETNVSSEEINQFLNHPIKSYQKAKKFKEFFSHPELIKRIEFHHERRDGTGFPSGVSYSLTSKIEQLIIASDNLITFEEKLLSFEAFNLKPYLKSIYNEDKNILSIEKILRTVHKEWREAA